MELEKAYILHSKYNSHEIIIVSNIPGFLEALAASILSNNILSCSSSGIPSFVSSKKLSTVKTKFHEYLLSISSFATFIFFPSNALCKFIECTSSVDLRFTIHHNMHVIKNFYLQLNTLTMKCQGQTILLRYKCNSLYPSSIQHAIKFQGMKITLL